MFLNGRFYKEDFEWDTLYITFKSNKQGWLQSLEDEQHDNSEASAEHDKACKHLIISD